MNPVVILSIVAGGELAVIIVLAVTYLAMFRLMCSLDDRPDSQGQSGATDGT